MRIAHGAARIKRAEILAHVVLGQQKKPGRSSSSDIAPLSREEIGRVRGLLLSVMDDWRSLAIRCVACLYRLQGILKTLEAEDDGDCRNNPSLVDTERTPLMVREAREAMHVYGPLAEQLGFHRLKSAIEQRAFEILYRRQHRAVSSLFREKGDVMRKLSRFLLSSVSSLLREDEAFMSQLEDLRVTTRVKEPYSFWRKLLKARKKKKIDRLRLLTAGQTSSGLETVGGSTLKHPTNRILRPSFPSPDLSIANVQDGIALRVILKARKWSDEEPDEETRARERLLCYYGQHLIRKRWPEVSPSRIKDYIDNPKPNGYRSLHHTSLVSFNGADYFPFEVQIRSEEMHRAAEFGVAAHWDYKLSGQSPSVVATDESSPGAGSSMPPVGFIQEGSDGTGSVRLSDPDFEDDVYKSPSQIEATEAEISPPLGSSHLDALVTAKESLVKERVHVFVVGGSGFEERGGSILSLPRRSSTVGDALRLALRGTTSESPTYPSSSMPSMLPFTGFVGEALDGTDTVALSLPPPPLSYTVWKNGVLVDVYDKLENGDVLVVDAAMASRPAVLLPESCG
jgi:ppGpp synthetase/RelA/SpoT-type nucleotidyltranferase